jgi:hypothetical protein
MSLGPIFAFNTRNIAAADEIFAPDFYSHPLKIGVERVIRIIKRDVVIY